MLLVPAYRTYLLPSCMYNEKGGVLPLLSGKFLSVGNQQVSSHLLFWGENSVSFIILLDLLLSYKTVLWIRTGPHVFGPLGYGFIIICTPT
jgi:hypothetical protein